MSGEIPEEVYRRFPEYDRQRINVDDFKPMLIERILESGGRNEVRWLFSSFSKEDVIQFLQSTANRRISPVSLTFWCKYFDIARPTPFKSPLWKR